MSKGLGLGMLFSEVKCNTGNGHVGAPRWADKHIWVTFEGCQIGTIQAALEPGAPLKVKQPIKPRDRHMMILATRHIFKVLYSRVTVGDWTQAQKQLLEQQLSTSSSSSLVCDKSQHSLSSKHVSRHIFKTMHSTVQGCPCTSQSCRCN